MSTNQPRKNGIDAIIAKISIAILNIKNGKVFLKHPKKLIFKDSIRGTPPSEISAGANQNIIITGINNKRTT